MRGSTCVLVALLTAAVLTAGCGKVQSPVAVDVAALDYVYVEGSSCVALVAGQSIVAGDVCVSLSGPEFGQTLSVTYATSEGWEITEAHLWVGENLADMPQTRKGNPKVGEFPYASGPLEGVAGYTFEIPLADLGNEPYVCDRAFHIAAHASLRKDDGAGGVLTESAWGEGDRFVERGNWATYFTVAFTCSPLDPLPILKCRTSFAYGGITSATCFNEIDEDGDGQPDFNRWGWTNSLLGPGSYEFDMYQGAARCDVDGAVKVGVLTVDYSGSMAIVTLETIDRFSLRETQLYVGSEVLERNADGEFTVAIGDFERAHENLDGATFDQFVLADLSGPLHVVAHAVVCSPMF
jgi:hypothetical protein